MNNHNLFELDLAHNNIQKEGFRHCMQMFTYGHPLQIFKAGNNYIHFEEGFSFKEMGEFNVLFLELQGNHFTEHDALELLKFVKNNFFI